MTSPEFQPCSDAFSDKYAFVGPSILVSLDDFGKLPENISVFLHVDQIAVLKQANVFISHCGMNSENESLYFGVPLIMFPRTSEQGEHYLVKIW